MANTKISALPAAILAAAANEFAINEAGASKKLTLDLLREYIIKRTAGVTTAAGEFITWLVLAANNGDVTGTGLVTQMTITGVGVGRYWFKCVLIYQTSATTTGIGVAVNHTGTLTQFIAEKRQAATGTSAATNAPSTALAGAAGNIYEGQSIRTKDTLIGAVSVSVDAADSDMMAIIEGFFVVSVTGSLQIKLQSELATLVSRAMQGSYLQLHKLS